MKSSTLPIYERWLLTAKEDQIQKVDAIYLACEQHYSEGGDLIVETFSPDEVLQEFQEQNYLEQVKAMCNAHTEQATNCRWGEDSDPELQKKQWK